jgi:glycerol kinase
MLAGIGCGLFREEADSASMSKTDRLFNVEMNPDERASHQKRWADAIARCRGAHPSAT